MAARCSSDSSLRSSVNLSMETSFAPDIREWFLLSREGDLPGSAAAVAPAPAVFCHVSQSYFLVAERTCDVLLNDFAVTCPNLGPPIRIKITGVRGYLGLCNTAAAAGCPRGFNFCGALRVENSRGRRGAGGRHHEPSLRDEGRVDSGRCHQVRGAEVHDQGWGRAARAGEGHRRQRDRQEVPGAAGAPRASAGCQVSPAPLRSRDSGLDCRWGLQGGAWA